MKKDDAWRFASSEEDAETSSGGETCSDGLGSERIVNKRVEVADADESTSSSRHDSEDIKDDHPNPHKSRNGEEKLFEQPFYFSPKTAKFNEKFQSAVYPHLESFNLFLDYFMQEIPKHIEPLYIDPHYKRIEHELSPFFISEEYLKVSIVKIDVGRPYRAAASDSSLGGTDKVDLRLLPKHCRLSHVSYGAPMYVTFAWSNSQEPHPRLKRVYAGCLPIMIKSNRCTLAGLTPEQMISYAGEDLDETGGYFIVNGNERAIRFIIQQRVNFPIAIKKPSLANKGLFYGEYAVSLRGMRSDGTSTANIMYYTEDNQCMYRILLNRQERVVNFWTLLKALMPTVSLPLIKSKILEGCDDLHEEFEFHDLWSDMVESDPLVTDLDKYEDRYLHLLGRVFWDGLQDRLKPGSSYEDCGRTVIDRYVLVHCQSWNAKFECLLLMWRKLWAVKSGKVTPDNVDSFAFQELLTPGNLFAAVLKDELFKYLHTSIKSFYQIQLRTYAHTGEDPVNIVRSEGLFEQSLRRVTDVAAHINNFLATGNIKTGQLDLQQLSGWTIVADRLNLHRFVAHFRAVHRGQFFAQMRTTEVRKLLGETWGFLCPVHTPDGGPCGLLLHLSQDAKPVASKPDGSVIAKVKRLVSLRGYEVDLTGRVMVPAVTRPDTFALVCDGEPICRLPFEDFEYWADLFRTKKNEARSGIPSHVEVVAFDKSSGGYPGMFLFSTPGRLVRPIRNVETRKIEWIGPLAQPWVPIACMDEDVEPSRILWERQQKEVKSFVCRGPEEELPDVCAFPDTVEKYRKYKNKRAALNASGKFDYLVGASSQEEDETEDSTKERRLIQKRKWADRLVKAGQSVAMNYRYVEISPTSFLSIAASFTPFSNHNQSPRNMYQCQMMKQTMGSCYHNVANRNDNKSYRLLNPQRPLVRTEDYAKYNFDQYSSGTNAIVAVITYSGYDLEDAMIINRHTIERGGWHGHVYKTKKLDACPDPMAHPADQRKFAFANKDNKSPGLDDDGLPAIGTYLTRGSPYYRVENLELKASGRPDYFEVHKWKDDEPAYVEHIHWSHPTDGGGGGNDKFQQTLRCQRVSLFLRCGRNPIVGDKFASRAGQKGILSLHYPAVDMPFTASGMTPDILFNPHGFPSRMTIGMIIESMAGKAAALTGETQNATPFKEFNRRLNHINRQNKWIDQCGYHGWSKRGGRYMTPVEDELCVTDDPVDYFGKVLQSHGYSYYGTEPLYSGIHGFEMEVQIFIGVIYYQRLRHMVSDKWQCRATGPIDSLTRQPVKGRKRHGGVRFGEMERDALLSHGASFCLQDRLLHCSDQHDCFVCPKCGSILSPTLEGDRKRTIGGGTAVPFCRVCPEVPARLCKLPYVFRYLSNELIAMGVTVRLHLSEGDRPLLGE